MSHVVWHTSQHTVCHMKFDILVNIQYVTCSVTYLSTYSMYHVFNSFILIKNHLKGLHTLCFTINSKVQSNLPLNLLNKSCLMFLDDLNLFMHHPWASLGAMIWLNHCNTPLQVGLGPSTLYLSVWLSICPIYLSVCPSVCLTQIWSAHP